jgi:hypothetical protein
MFKKASSSFNSAIRWQQYNMKSIKAINVGVMMMIMMSGFTH